MLWQRLKYFQEEKSEIFLVEFYQNIFSLQCSGGETSWSWLVPASQLWPGGCSFPPSLQSPAPAETTSGSLTVTWPGSHLELSYSDRVTWWCSDCLAPPLLLLSECCLSPGQTRIQSVSQGICKPDLERSQTFPFIPKRGRKKGSSRWIFLVVTSVSSLL